MRGGDEKAGSGGYYNGDECCTLFLEGDERVDEREGVGKERD